MHKADTIRSELNGIRQRMNFRSVIGLAVLTGLAGVANFIYQIFTASALDPAAFSLLASFLAIVAIVGATTGSLQVVTARVFSTRTDWSHEIRTFDRTTVQGLAAVAILLVPLLIFSPTISSSLGVSVPVFLLLLLFLPVSVLTSLLLGKVQGSGYLITLGVILLAISTVKLGSAVMIVQLSGGAVSLIAALVGASTIVLICAWIMSPVRGSSAATLFSLQTSTLVAAQLSFWGIATTDVIVARVGLAEVSAGQFAAAAAIAKLVLFLPGVLTTAILPMAGALVSVGENRVRFALWSVGLTACLAVLSAVLVWFAAPWIISTLLGPAYAESTTLVGFLALAYVPLSVAGATLQFHFTSRRRKYALFASGSFLAMLTAFVVGPDEAWFYIAVVGVTGLLLLVSINIGPVVTRLSIKQSTPPEN